LFTVTDDYDSLVVVDLGYSAKKKSCGIAYDGGAVELTFGDAIYFCIGLLNKMNKPCLVLEAPLSTYHDEKGNPGIRGEFEHGRGWYYGAGAMTALAAKRFLEMMRPALSIKTGLAEAFLSNKESKTGHADDAIIILKEFTKTKPVEMRQGCEPIIKLNKVPPVKSFT